MSDPSATPPIDVLLRHREWLRRLAASIVVDEARADDLVQKTLLAALERPPAHASHPRAWLATVARRLSRADDARVLRQLETERRAARPEAQSPSDAVVAEAALQHEMSAAVLALDEPYRTAILLRFSSNLSPRAIAKRTGAPVETVRTRIKRGLELLRAEFVRRRGAAGAAGSTWAVALVGLLDSGMRRAVRRAVLAKATGAATGVGAGLVGASTLAGVLGVLGMTTKLKLAAAVVVLAGGTFAVVKLCEPPKLPPRDAVARGSHEAPALAAPARVDPKELAQPAEATRAAESRDTSKEAPPTAPAATLTGVVEGIVVTARGEPAAGATVLLEDASRQGEFATLEELCANFVGLLDGPFKPHDLRQRVVAAADGSFRFTDLVRGGAVNVAAIHAEEGTALQAGVVVARGETPTRVELTLAAGVVLRGTVTDGEGAPIAKASVQLNRFGHTKEGGTTSSSFLTVMSDAEGRYRTIPLPYRGFQIGAHMEGFLSGGPDAPIEILENERERVVDFRLFRAVTLRGRILVSDGSPARLAHAAGDFTVGATDRDPRTVEMSIDMLDGRGVLRRDEDRYELTPRRSGLRFISIWASDTLIGAAEIADAGAGRGVGPDVVVDLAKAPAPTPTGTLAIEVVSAGDGAPVAQFHAEVVPDPTTARDPRAIFEKHQGDGASGRLEIAGLRVGDYDLSIRAKGYVGRVALARVAVATAATRIELKQATGFVSGRVQDENGRPVVGARIFLLATDGRVATPYPECTTASDAEGGFVFKGVAEGDALLVAEADGLAPAAAAATALAKGDAARAEPLLTLRAGAMVSIHPHGVGVEVSGPFMYRIRDERGATVVDHHRYPGAITSSFGGGSEFRLAAGSYAVEVFCPKFVTGTAKFTAVAGKVVEVELVPLADEGGGR